MYTWNDIVILGDSFCGQRKVPNHWPYRLSNLLTDEDPGPTKPARGYGWGGASWWSVKKQLAFYLKNQPKVLIFCHTEPMRLPNDRNKPLTLACSLDGSLRGDPNDDDLWTAAKLYFQHLVSEDFHLWAQQQWFRELDETLDLYPSIEQVYHLHGFYGKWNNYEFKRGVRFKDNLFNYSHPDNDTMKYDNHLSINDNHRLAQQLAELIKNYPGDGHVVSKFNLKDKK